MEMDIKTMLIEKFQERYGGGIDDIRLFFAPGRVNLIGEHIDYNGGYVFPVALDIGTYAAVREREDRVVSFATLNFDEKIEVNIDDIQYQEADGWTNYPKGVIKMYEDKGYKINGFEVLYYGNIPNGSGLSSSASLEVLTATIINTLNGNGENMIELVKLSQRAENEFVGVNCGIMDQFAVGMGRQDCAILLDCNTLDYTYAPMKLEGIKIVIGNTKKRRGLADSKYNERRNECEYALDSLKKSLEIKNLCDINQVTFERYKELIEDETARKRALHAIAENERVVASMEALKNKDIEGFGKLMNDSHNSLRDLYEVTGIELDTMVKLAQEQEGTLGARMTGAGFGGCIVALVKEESVASFIKNVGEKYKEAIGLKPEFYIATVGEGAREITKEV
jgi:galactokinase